VRLRRLGLLAALLAAAGCDSPGDGQTSVELRVGQGAADSLSFSTETSLAEYTEVPGSGNELRLTLASYEASCDEFIPPGKGDASVSVVIVTPEGVTPTSGVYPWLGHEAHGGTATSPEKPYSFPTARIESKSFTFRAGGGVVVKNLTLNRHGSVSGLLNFEFAGDAESPATSVQGRFSAKICRYNSAKRT
jgi:hypothetical protein